MVDPAPGVPRSWCQPAKTFDLGIFGAGKRARGGMFLDSVDAMNFQSLNAKSMSFRCPGCQEHPAWYRRYRLIAMGCGCAAMSWDYRQLPFFPQCGDDWRRWLSLPGVCSRCALRRGDRPISVMFWHASKRPAIDSNGRRRPRFELRVVGWLRKGSTSCLRNALAVR